MAVQNTNLVGRTQNATIAYEMEQRKEADDLNAIDERLQGVIDKIGGTDPDTTPKTSPEVKENIPKDKPFVGYYVKIDGEYGIIYADLAVGTEGTNTWQDQDGMYEVPKENSETLKDYYITEENYKPEGMEGFKAKPVLEVSESNDEGKKDRFYVMALKDFGDAEKTYEWYSDGTHLAESNTSENFGSGITNTTEMLGKCNDAQEGDFWKLIKEEYGEGKWFVPSKEEWSAFAYELDIDAMNYKNFGLRDKYWTSSIGYSTENQLFANYIIFNSGLMGSTPVERSKQPLCTPQHDLLI